MGTPDARLAAAARAYEEAYATARPGTASDVRLARARIDLTLLLAEGEELDPAVQAQLERDGETLLRTAPALEV